MTMTKTEEHLPPLDYKALLEKLLKVIPDPPTNAYCCDDAEDLRRQLAVVANAAYSVDEVLEGRAKEIRCCEAAAMLRTPPSTWEGLPAWLLAVSESATRHAMSRGDGVFVTSGHAAAQLPGGELPDDTTGLSETKVAGLSIPNGSGGVISVAELQRRVKDPEELEFPDGRVVAVVTIQFTHLNASLVEAWILAPARLAGDLEVRLHCGGQLDAVVCEGSTWTSAVMPLLPPVRFS